MVRNPRSPRAGRPPEPGLAVSTSEPETVGSNRAILLAPAFTAILLALTLLPRVRSNPNLLWSCVGAGLLLLAATGATFLAARRSGRKLAIEVVLRPQHYLQACAHFS